MKKRMKSMIKVVFACFAIVLTFMVCGCHEDSKSGNRDDFAVEEAAYAYAAAGMEMPMPAPTAVNTTMRVAQKSSAAPMQAQVGGMNVVEAEAGAEENERKLVKTGSISFEVENLDTTDALVTQWAEQYGGYVFSSGSNTTNAFRMFSHSSR